MYEEITIEGRCQVHVTCDMCDYGVTVIFPTRDRAQWELYRLGWRLHRHNQLCPEHAEIAANVLRRNIDA